MRFFFYAAAIALACIPQCLAMTWEQVYGSVNSMQKKGTGGWTTWYAKVNLGEEFTSDISYSSLLEVAEAHWNYVRKQTSAFTTGGSCLVAAVYVPGGNVILSTIPRGSATKTDTMFGEMMSGAATNAPHWWADRTGRRIDAEDGAVYLTEVEGYIDKHGLKLAVYGTHKGSGDTVGGPINPCNDCKTMLGPTKMNIPFFSSSSAPDDETDQYTAEQLFKRSQEKRVVKTPKKSSSSSSTKTSSTSPVKATTSLSTSISSTKAASSVATATDNKASSIITAKTGSASSTDTKVVSSGTKASSTSLTASSASGTGTVVTPVRLTPVPFTISLSDQPDYDMGSTAATATAKETKNTASSSSSVSENTSTGTATSVISASVTAATTLETSTVKPATASA